MHRMSDEEFERAIDEALESIPVDALENVAIVMQDEPEEYQLESFDDDDDVPMCGDELLGLYEGVPLTEREDGAWDMPDVISIFKGPHERSFDSREEIVEEIRKTVVHEIGHYFGLDDEGLYEMGY